MPRDIGSVDTEMFQVREADLDLVGDVDEEAVYTLRPLSLKQVTEFQKRHTKRKGVRETTDTWAAHADTLDYILVEWEGWLLNGEPCPCTREYKLKLPAPIQNELISRALNYYGPEVDRAAAFRQPA